MTLTTPMHSFVSFQWSGSLTSERFSWLKTGYRPRNGAPTRGAEWFFCPFVLTCWEMIQPVLTKAVLSTMQSKGIGPFPCHAACKTHYILLACILFLALRATAILHTPSSRWQRQWLKYPMYNTNTPRDSQLCMSKYKAYTRICYKIRG